MAELACPVCGRGDLDAGVVVGRSPGVKFKASRGILGDLSGILLTSGFFNHSASAHPVQQLRHRGDTRVVDR